jgi:hypothetical protein
MTQQPPTDWSQFTLPQIWAMLSAENATAGDAQAKVWYEVETACRTHADHLIEAVRQLNAVWPATPNSASETFQRFAAQLIGSMRETARTSYNNGLTLESFHADLMETRGKVERIATEYQQRLADEQSYGYKAGYLRLAGPDWRADLTAEARATMAKSDTSAQLSTNLVQIPTAYEVRAKHGTDDPPEPGSGGGAGSGGSSVGSGVVRFDATGMAPPTHVVRDDSADRQPTLAGVVIPGAMSEQGPLTGGRSTSAVSSPSYPAGIFSPGTPSGRSVIGGLPGDHVGSSATPREGAARWAAAGAPGEAGLRGASTGGGMVGGMPMMAGGRPTTGNGTRVARAGEVIGGDRRRRRGPKDPDDPWVLDQGGVEPVIGGTPSDEFTHDAWGDLPDGVVSIQGWPR